MRICRGFSTIEAVFLHLQLYSSGSISPLKFGAFVMLGLILAAGEGKRLRPHTETRPKPLIPVFDRPLIMFVIDLLRGVGVDRFVFVVSYMKEIVQNATASMLRGVADVEYVDQGEPRGTAHAVSKALKEVDDDIVIVTYGDLYLDPLLVQNLTRDVDRVKKGLVDGVVYLSHVRDVSRYGKAIIDGERILRIEEKPLSGGEGYANVGLYVFRGKLLELVNEISLSPRGEYELTDIVGLATSRGYNIGYTLIDEEAWMDIAYPWNIIDLHKRLLRRLSGKIIKGEIDQQATIKGPVVVEENAKIRGATYIEGPAYIGREADVGPNSYIRPYTVIMEGSRIGFSVEVKESVIMEHVHASHLTYIGDSVIGEHSNLGAGTITANLRFDEKTVKVAIDGLRVDSGRKKLGAMIGGYVKTGVNVSIMPGVKIGSYSWIYPGVTVYRDVPPKTVVKEDWR